MKRHINLLAIAVIALAAIFASGGKSVRADSSLITYTLTCSSIFTTYDLNPAEYISVELESDHSIAFVQQQYGPGSSSPAIPFFATWPAVPEGTLLSIIIGDSVNSLFTVVPCTNPVAAAGSQAVTWCNLSGDGRIDGRCGDRIAVYCNASATPPNLDVWVIDNSSVGHELAKLPLADLVPSLTKNLGADGIIYAGSDASGNGWVALSGGPYGGTAAGDWAKAFTCKAAS